MIEILLTVVVGVLVLAGVVTVAILMIGRRRAGVDRVDPAAMNEITAAERAARAGHSIRGAHDLER
jgi:Flp pilus assembly protein protease CpaA